MSGRHPEQLAAIVLEAIAKSGQRGLLLTGWGGLRADLVPDNVFVLDSAPHRWLFPRMAAVVYHDEAVLNRGRTRSAARWIDRRFCG